MAARNLSRPVTDLSPAYQAPVKRLKGRKGKGITAPKGAPITGKGVHGEIPTYGLQLQQRDGSSALVSYLRHLERRGLSAKTLKTYRSCLRDFGRFLAESRIANPLKASADDISEFQVWLSEEEKRKGGHAGRYSASYLGTHVAVIRGLYRWLHAEFRTFVDPAKRLQYPRRPRKLKKHVLSSEEVRKLIDQPGESREGLRDRVVLRLLVLSGPRTSELAAVDVNDVSLPDRELTIRSGKGGKDRLTFFDPGTREAISRYLLQSRPFLAGRDEPALLVSDSGRRIRGCHLNEIVSRHAKAAGIGKPVTPLTLRHSFCTNLLRHGANLKVIAELAGHGSLNTTAGYTRVDIGELSSVYMAAHPRSGA